MMKLNPNPNQLTKAAIQESIEKIETGLMCAPMTCVYIVKWLCHGCLGL